MRVKLWMVAKMRIIIAYILLLVFASGVRADENDANVLSDEVMDEITDFVEQNAEDGISEEMMQTIADDLEELRENKVNLNDEKNLKKGLEKLLFLNDEQIENICEYVYTYGPVKDVGELIMVRGIYNRDVMCMIPFVEAGETGDRGRTSIRAMLTKGKHEITAKGSTCGEASERSQYYAGTTYRYRYKDRLFVGIGGEKDAGEKFWSDKRKGMDSYNMAIQYCGVSWLDRIIAGDFNASFGYGLVMNTGFMIRTSDDVSLLKETFNGVRKRAGTSEYGLTHGAAMSVRLGKHFDLTGFYSNKNVDATLNDSGMFTGINMTGLHRTEAEEERRGSVNMEAMGLNVSYTHRKMQLGLTGIYYNYDHEKVTDGKWRNVYRMSGKEQVVIGMNYAYKYKLIGIKGETATDIRGGMATTNELNVRASSMANVFVGQRYYNKKYDNVFSNVIRMGGAINDESGIRIGARISAISRMRLTGYADVFWSEWLKHNLDGRQQGYLGLIQADCYPTENLILTVRYTGRSQMRNLPSSNFKTTPTMSIPTRSTRNRLRFRTEYVIGRDERIRLKGECEMSQFGYEGQGEKSGWMVLCDVGYKLKHLPVKVNVRVNYFNVKDYDNRIYAYENDVLYNFATTMMYGEGMRYYVNINAKINKHLSMYVKMGQYRYFSDRQITYGNEKIDGRKRTDIRFMTRITF